MSTGGITDKTSDSRVQESEGLEAVAAALERQRLLAEGRSAL